jgi:alpha-tubulin suppressor-like RCC1 family protein
MRLTLVSVVAAIGLATLACGQRTDESPSRDEALSGPKGDEALGVSSLAMGNDHTCVIARRGVECWGSNSSGQARPPALRHPRQVTAGASHTCALDDDGVRCWGTTSYGLGTVPPLRNPRQVDAGNYHTCALDDVGVKCWGYNAYGQVNVPPLRGARQVGAGHYHSCALDEDGVKCWGTNDNGETNVPPLRHPRLLSVGNYHNCALDDDGVKCWGKESLGGETQVPELRHPRDVSAAGYQTCALDDDGVKCWGDYGLEAIPSLPSPTRVVSGYKSTCAIDDDEVVCWGDEDNGKTEVPLGLSLVGHHTCAVSSRGLSCVGDNEHGQLGVGDDQDRVLSLAAASLTDLGRSFGVPVQVGLGHSYACALSRDGAVKCWGSNAYGQLGLGTARDRGITLGDMGDALPVLSFGNAGPMAKLDVGDHHACSLSARGEVFCWGDGSSGQLGTDAAGRDPVRLDLGKNLVVRDVSIGTDHTCLLDAEGSVHCLGGGLGTAGDPIQPVLLGDGFRVKVLASGNHHACAVSDDGRVKCWGRNDRGQLGLGDTRARGVNPAHMGNALPVVDLGQGQFVVDVACGSHHCCAKTIQNTMKCWGDNSEGQLGLGDTVARGTDPSTMGDNLPFVQTPPHEGVLSMQLEGKRTCARTDSGLRCWGRNYSGELGYGDREPRGGSVTTIPRALPPLGL